MTSRWIFTAFAVGVAVGIAATWVVMDGARDPAPTIDNPFAAPRVPLSTVPATNNTGAAPPATPVKSTAAKIEPVSAPPAPVAAAASDQNGATVDDASVQQIDAGPVFNKQIAQPSIPGFENQLGDAHRALERETRNDGWAYAMEAEIQNAMVNEVSTGAFLMEHLECRATMCEVRLSGKADQAAAIKHWNEGLGAQPFGQRLFPSYSSSISNDERVDSLIIFRRPPTPPRPR
jgi:hypothetical protein